MIVKQYELNDNFYNTWLNVCLWYYTFNDKPMHAAF